MRQIIFQSFLLPLTVISALHAQTLEDAWNGAGGSYTITADESIDLNQFIDLSKIFVIEGATGENKFIITNTGASAELILQEGSSLTMRNFIFTEVDEASFSTHGFINHGTLILENMEFNDWYTVGSSVINNNQTVESISHSSFQSNKATGPGGAINNDGALDSTETNVNIKLIDNAHFTQNVSESYGGAIASINGADIDTISNSTFSKNEATFGSGGALFAGKINPAFLTAPDKESTIKSITYTTFVENTASSNGGAIYLESNTTGGDYSGNIESIDNSEFRGNIAATYGGAICYNVTGKSMSISDTDFIDNKALYGGAFANLKASDVEVTSAIFKGNQATLGGAILNSASSTWTISASRFESNKSSSSGGAINNYSSSGVFNISSSQFVSNQAAGSGGAIYNRGGVLNLIDTDFLNNIVLSETAIGGAIYSSGTVNLWAQDQDVMMSGNMIQRAAGNISNAIVNANGTVNLNAASTRQLQIDDEILGASLSSILNVNKAIAGAPTGGDVILNGAITDHTINHYAGHLTFGKMASVSIGSPSFSNTQLNVYGGTLEFHRDVDSVAELTAGINVYQDTRILFRREEDITQKMLSLNVAANTERLQIKAITELTMADLLTLPDRMLIEGFDFDIDWVGAETMEAEYYLSEYAQGIEAKDYELYYRATEGDEWLRIDELAATQASFDAFSQIYNFTFSENGQYALTVTIPEPSTATISLAALLLLMTRRRRKGHLAKLVYGKQQG